MSDNITNKILLIGTGPMACSYAKVLSGINADYAVVGRGEQSAKKFCDETGVEVVTGGLENFLRDTNEIFSHAILATGTEALTQNLNILLKKGIVKILIEKPAALSIEELEGNLPNYETFASGIFVAYNRRFYASVLEAERLLEEDGGLQSISFEFTEWVHKIDPSKKAQGVMENWFFANSTHVVDLAFFMAGKPEQWCAFSKSGKLSWHSKTNFSGAGITNKNVLFSYLSNWESAGRWAIELLTEKRRIYLKPLESVIVQQKGSVALEEHLFDDQIDKTYKPGLYKQTQAFLAGDKTRFATIEDHLKMSVDVYRKMLA